MMHDGEDNVINVNTVVASEHIGHPRWQVEDYNLIRDFPRELAKLRS
jgi:hypothetical protein